MKNMYMCEECCTTWPSKSEAEKCEKECRAHDAKAQQCAHKNTRVAVEIEPVSVESDIDFWLNCADCKTELDHRFLDEFNEAQLKRVWTALDPDA